MITAGLFGSAIPVGAVVGFVFSGVLDKPSTSTILALYSVAGLLAYGLSLSCVLVALTFSGDHYVRATLRTLAWVVPIGAVVAVAAGIGVAWASDFTPTEPTWIATCMSVVVVVGATFGVGRSITLRRSPEFEGHA